MPDYFGFSKGVLLCPDMEWDTIVFDPTMILCFNWSCSFDGGVGQSPEHLRQVFPRQKHDGMTGAEAAKRLLNSRGFTMYRSVRWREI